jgi:hypothetical protein
MGHSVTRSPVTSQRVVGSPLLGALQSSHMIHRPLDRGLHVGKDGLR